MANDLGLAIPPSLCPVLQHISLQSLTEARRVICTNRTDCELLGVRVGRWGEGEAWFIEYSLSST